MRLVFIVSKIYSRQWSYKDIMFRSRDASRGIASVCGFRSGRIRGRQNRRLQRLPRRGDLHGVILFVGAEGQLELVGDLRPELAQHVPSHIAGNTETNSAGRGAEAPRISGMVKISDQLGADGAEPLGAIEHPFARVTMGNEAVFERVSEPRWC